MSRRLIKLAVSFGVHCYDVSRDTLGALLGRARSPRAVVLYYHAVPGHDRERFRRQMDQLLKLARPLAAGSLKPPAGCARSVLVTFDDGFVSVVEHALPVLQERQIPCVIFVPSGCLGQNPSWIRHAGDAARQEQVISLRQLEELGRNPLVTIGSHTVNHRHLVEASGEAAANELLQSKQDLEQATGQPVEWFSFPYGAHNERLHQQARESGYRRVFTSEPGLAFCSDQEFATGRVPVEPTDWGLEFRLKATGAYRWVARRQRARQQCQA